MPINDSLKLLAALGGILAAGCDPVRTTIQPVHLRIEDATSGKPITDAIVQLKYDFKTGVPEPGKPGAPTQERYESARDFWAQSPWTSGVTDSKGTVEAQIRVTALDRSWGTTPPGWRDEKGKPFLVKVQRKREPEEQVDLRLDPGQTARSKNFTFTIKYVEAPRYTQN